MKIFQENIRRYQQLRSMLRDTRGSHNLLKKVNTGLDGVLGILIEMPIKDERILGDLARYRDALKKVEQLYGVVPKSKEALLQKLHDRTVSESIKMISQALKYTKTQELNVKRLTSRVRAASPKGAAKMNVEVNSAILHSLNQLIKINGQMLKVQAENLGTNNKGEKEHVNYLRKMKKDFNQGVKTMRKDDFKMQRFN